ncbi:MAG: TOBE domain-containing protein, partial [candidate division Zixibacteria bacterium]|nr:TOBE domain-containing protein [candidate division Zixibacteria bacterium]
VMQNPVMFDTTVFKNVAYGLKVRKRDLIKKRVEKGLDLVKMTQAMERKALSLSGGEIQRVALAQALVLDPEIIFLDEPTNNLDSISQRIIGDLILKLKERKDKTIVLTTHSLSSARRWGENFYVLKEGRIIQKGEREDIFNRPASVFLAEFLGMDNLFFGRLEREDGQIKLGVQGMKFEVVTEKEGEAYATIPPEDILISSSPLLSSARNCFKGKIIQIEEEERVVKVKVDIGIPLVSLVTKRSKEEMGLASGKVVYLTFKASAVNLFQDDQI